MFKSLSFVAAASATAFAAAVATAVSANANEKMNNAESGFLHYDQYMSDLSTAASSAVESFLSIKPMFDLKPVDSTSYLNHTAQTHIFGFEKIFESQQNVDSVNAWMRRNWKSSFTFAFVYVALVFLGQTYMRSRPRYELRVPLVLWNLFLAGFSILGTIRVWPDFVHSLSHEGFLHSICDNSYAYGITGFWAFMFILSKLPELIDTLFIVLRKQELIFLHWYHHATVLIYCWYSYADFTASGRWFMSMNYLIHAVMYSYYACKALKIRVPKFISQIITTSQIVQMIIGCYVNYVAWQTKLSSPNAVCRISDSNIKYSFLMYLSYFILFFNFFYNAYIANKKSRSNRQLANAAAASAGKTQEAAVSAASSSSSAATSTVTSTAAADDNDKKIN